MLRGQMNRGVRSGQCHTRHFYRYGHSVYSYDVRKTELRSTTTETDLIERRRDDSSETKKSRV